MRRRELRIQDDVRDAIRATHPEARKKIWRAIDELRDDPFEGRALREQLVGLWRFPVGRLRIVYRFDAGKFEVVAVAPRVTVYEDLVRSLGERRARYRRVAAGRRASLSSRTSV